MSNERQPRRGDPAVEPDVSSAGPVPASPDPLSALMRRHADGSLAGATSPAGERALLLALQRSAGNAKVARLLRTAAPPSVQPPGQENNAAPPAGALLVADDAAALAPGQMRQGQFLDEVQRTVTTTAEQRLSPMWAVMGCPWIEHWIAYYRARRPEETESAARRYAPAAAGAATAAGVVAAIVERVDSAIAQWQETGEMPAGLPGQEAGGPAAPAEGEEGPPTGDAPSLALKLQLGAVSPSTDPRSVQRALGPGRPLDSGVRTRMSGALGAGLGGVRVHDDPAAGRLAERMHARAFTVGRHVAFAANEYAPGTMVGDALLAHELAHVVQQDGGAVSGAGAVAELEEDADRAAIGAVAGLHAGGLGQLRRRVGPSVRSGLQLQRCAAAQHAGATTPARATGAAVPGPGYAAAPAEGDNAIDARGLAIRAAAADASHPVEERGVAAVRSILHTYFSADEDKVQDVVFDARLGSGLETEVGNGENVRGIIHVSRDFVDRLPTGTYARFVLGVGHEILHINQHRAGMGGPARRHEREFLAHRWTMTAPEAQGTGRINAAARVAGIDEAIRHYHGMDDAAKERYRREFDELLELRRRTRAGARNPAAIDENPPTGP
jgi:hypothetical protein